MKKWEMPQVKISQFVANEYVASCTVSGSTVTIHCDYDGRQFFIPEHCESTDRCHDIVIPNNAFQSAINYCLDPSTTFKRAKCDSNGHWATGDQVAVSDFGGGAQAGDTAIELWVDNGNVFYNVYYKRSATVFGITTYWYDGGGFAAGYQNHWVYGTNNPNS